MPPDQIEPLTTTGGGNPAIDWLNLIDSDGGKIAYYRLILETPPWGGWAGFFGAGAESIYYFVLVLMSWGAGLVDWPTKTDNWLPYLREGYDKLAGHLFSHVNPIYIVGISMAMLIVSMVYRRVEGNNAQFAKAQWHRLGAAFVLMMFVIMMVSNPFAIIETILDFLFGLATAVTFTGDEGGVNASNASFGTDIIRKVNWLINYGKVLDAECARAWAEAQNNHGPNPACITNDPAIQSFVEPSMSTVGLAGFALVFALVFFVFSVVSAYYLVSHLSLAIGLSIGSAYVAAGSVNRRRPYDPLANTWARAARHGLYFVAVLAIIVILRSWLNDLITLWTDIPIFLELLFLAIEYILLTIIVVAINWKKESILSLFKDRITGSTHWKALYPGGNSKANITETILAAPGEWASQRYEQGKAWVSQNWQTYLTHEDEPSSSSTGDKTMREIPDTAESKAAQERVDIFASTPSITIDIDPDATASSGTSLTKPASSITDLDSQSRDATAAGGSTLGPDVTAAYAQQAMDAAQHSDTQLESAPTAPDAVLMGDMPPATQDFNAGMAKYWDAIKHVDNLQADANALRDSTSGPQTAADLSELANQHYRAVDILYPDAPNLASDDIDQPAPSILDSAQWLQRMKHSRKMLQAKGIYSIMTMTTSLDTDLDVDFAVDEYGNNVVKSKHGVGFGDYI
ncbi:Uncharacterised protein [Mycobacteroides abscessus subsp. abscessus]|uniref:hypothetical protein n=1 Tax=Mycobacteroides abscessus TaxID=36809 RepID=UPI00092AA8E4|nr:hypothetical protein [Mycobacteroides abscessus]SIH21733.1 Uncharacterised protein [Mycobacteroides abscessus subsp. abscessus]